MYKNALAAIANLDSGIIEVVIQEIKLKMSDAQIRQITKDDYFTYLTPEDELYDKSVVPGLVKSKSENCFCSCLI